MSSETTLSTDRATLIADGICGSCGNVNSSRAKFCGGCGQSLQEDCEKCGKRIFLTQVFCGDCGTNLSKLVEKKRERYYEFLAEAKVAANEFRYRDATRLLKRITELDDYRFAEIVSTANRTLNKVVEIEGKTNQTIAEACELARTAYESGATKKVVEHLQRIPDHLLDREAKQLLNEAQSYLSQRQNLEAGLKKEINGKNWEMVGRLVQQLIELDPEHESARRLGKQVSEKLVHSALRSSSNGEFQRAVDKLRSIPNFQQTEEVRKVLSKVLRDEWMWRELISEPFISHNLCQFANRLSESYPDLQVVRDLQQKIKELLRSKRPTGRSPWIQWRGKSNSWLGGPAGALVNPQVINLDNGIDLQSHPAAFNVAIGLAIQGVGKARVSEDFLIKKKSLFSSTRKSSVAWGLDIGTSSVKAVQLEDRNGELFIKDTFYGEIEPAPSRDVDGGEQRKRLAPLINSFLQERYSEEVPIWANLNSSHTVNRFLRLPPVKNRDAMNLLNKEIESKIPIPLDELMVTRWICPGKRLPTMGRPAMASTARREVITRRISFLESLGLKLAGLQSDNIALVNFADQEFSQMWPRVDSLTEDNVDAIQNDLSNAICIVDAGASTTNLILVSAEAHWSWTIETGGDDLTFQLASSAKLSRQQAEKMKRNPILLPSITEQYQAVETALDTFRSRVASIYKEGLKHENTFRPVEIWCVGGSWQTYQWPRRILMEQEF